MFWVPKIHPHEDNKNQAKKLKVYRKNVDFHRPSPWKCIVCRLVKMLTFMDGPYVSWHIYKILVEYLHIRQIHYYDF